jgi:hypothetical protein
MEGRLEIPPATDWYHANWAIHPSLPQLCSAQSTAPSPPRHLDSQEKKATGHHKEDPVEKEVDHILIEGGAGPPLQFPFQPPKQQAKGDKIKKAPDLTGEIQGTASH